MMKEERNGWARVCDTCRSAACAVYCRADSAYLCAACDARVHAANRVASRHERVRVCEACERAPAAFICKADAASLCASCDADIHSANPLARRHHRVPVLPISAADPPELDDDDEEEEDDDDEDGDEEAASWLLLNPNRPAAAGININQVANNNNNGFLFGGGEVDEYLDLVEYNSGGGNEKMMTSPTSVMRSVGGGGGDSVVPCGGDGEENMNMMMIMMETNNNNNNNNNNNLQSSGFFQLGLDFDDLSSTKPSYSIYNDTISQSVSVSSLDVSVVPDSTMSGMSMISHPRPPKGTIDLFAGPPIQAGPTQLSPLDREARVLRYREKKKNRKFEKTIRYASRKAYAETRPRIKGRFAKRTDVDLEVDHMFDTGYGIVPSF